MSRRHGICTSLLHRWRRAARGEVPNWRAARSQLLPVPLVTPDAAPAPSRPPVAGIATAPIEVVLRNGQVLRVATTTDAVAATRLAAALEA